MIKLAIVGATGIVGNEALILLNTRQIAYDELFLFASKKSAGLTRNIRGIEHKIIEYISPDQFTGIDYVILAVNTDISKDIINRRHPNSRTVFIDNSSAFRMNMHTPLIVPEINIDKCYANTVIANPNCVTIIMLMALYPLHRVNKIKYINVNTYQAASGAGMKAVDELLEQTTLSALGKEIVPHVFKSQYLFNVFSHNSAVDEVDGFNGEEEKVINETRKILGDYIEMDVSCMRVPTLRSHLINLTVIFENDTTVEAITDILQNTQGICIRDDRKNNKFPEPLISSEQDDVCVGRIRRSYDNNNKRFLMSVCGDQIRKGAALNALQIYEKLISNI
jgi:aspartate-semialdehyde dehydrogenase